VVKEISKKKDNKTKSFLIVVTIVALFAISTPFVVYNYQLYRAHGETQAQRLQEIQRLQTNQDNISNALAKSDPNIKKDTTVAPPQITDFNLIDALKGMFSKIINFLKNPIPPLKHR
jgi:hypothetical protein